MAQPDQRMVCLGIVTAPHGVRGDVRVRTFTALPDDLVAYGDLRDEGNEREFEIRLGGRVRGSVIARITGVENRDAAERLRGLKLCVPRSALPEPGPEEYYHDDLIGLGAEVVDEAGNTGGTMLGRVSAVEDFGAGPVLEIAVASGPPVMVPFTRAVVPWVDLDVGRIGVAAIPGLLTAADAIDRSAPAMADDER